MQEKVLPQLRWQATWEMEDLTGVLFEPLCRIPVIFPGVDRCGNHDPPSCLHQVCYDTGQKSLRAAQNQKGQCEQNSGRPRIRLRAIEGDLGRWRTGHAI